MKKLLFLLFFFGFNNVYAESGTYSSSAVCDYDKSAINTKHPGKRISILAAILSEL